MNRPIIRVSSVTYAIRAQKLLERYGIRSYIKKLARNINVHGCGYGLEIAGDVAAAERILVSSGIRVIEVIGEGEAH